MNNELQQASPMDATLRGNILIAEFEGRKFHARKDNESLANEFDTYAECAAWCKSLKPRFTGFTPSIGFEWGCGLYNKEWNWLIPAWSKFYEIAVEKWYHPNNRDAVTAQIAQFEIWEHNFYAGIEVNCVQCSFDIFVQALTWFNFLTQKEAADAKADHE